MRPVTVLELPAGRVVEMKPGGYHVMLMELKRPLAVGERVRIDLRLETPDKRLITLPVDVDVAARAPGSTAEGNHKH
jgi:copper(I)-binding protein